MSKHSGVKQTTMRLEFYYRRTHCLNRESRVLSLSPNKTHQHFDVQKTKSQAWKLWKSSLISDWLAAPTLIMFQKSKLSLTSERQSKPFVGWEQHSPLAIFRSAQHVSVIIESPQKRVQEGSLGKQSRWTQVLTHHSSAFLSMTWACLKPSCMQVHTTKFIHSPSSFLQQKLPDPLNAIFIYWSEFPPPPHDPELSSDCTHSSWLPSCPWEIF